MLYRRLIISQDKDDIYMTFAEFDAAYTKYITTGQADDDEPFLKMYEFGPYNTNNPRHMRAVAIHTLAFVLDHVKT